MKKRDRKKIATILIAMMFFFKASILSANQSYENAETLISCELGTCISGNSIASVSGKTIIFAEDQPYKNVESEQPLVEFLLHDEIGSTVTKSIISTNHIMYQYTTDGWLQHVAIYADSVICTNVAGPREGVQFIIANNGALIDMCHNRTFHNDHFKNKYPWGEVRTYNNYQTVKFK